MTEFDPFQNAKGLIGGHPEQRKGDVGVKPLIHRYVLRPFHEPADIEHGKEFCANQTVEVEIGFARGHFLRERVQQAPEHRFLGFEIKRQWCDRMARFLDRENISNARVLHDDARSLLFRLLDPGQVSAFYVFFPDPWWKKRHHKRRVMSEETVKALHTLLKEGGSLHIRTDVAAYADMVKELIEEHHGFETALPGRGIGGETLPYTHREKKCHELGIDVHSMHFVKTGLTK